MTKISIDHLPDHDMVEALELWELLCLVGHASTLHSLTTKFAVSGSMSRLQYWAKFLEATIHEPCSDICRACL
eukprot:CAMPEP_0114253750 /NCGR_PEP_ID=MMETSP0058-20121206/16572_1 /TAXON_ID=36894 /ORGANISM="Pyramimonas parkeae, CCMP726" /LENGTH=72 /DNA_ID=CAMNT_0001367843 /DNA_START=200 /DNA_END=418 /DNA_ORIENTATION=+